jgi:hypothetical protein
MKSHPPTPRRRILGFLILIAAGNALAQTPIFTLATPATAPAASQPKPLTTLAAPQIPDPSAASPGDPPSSAPPAAGTQPAQSSARGSSAAANPWEKIPSEDAVIVDFHSLGFLDGTTNIFRSGSPVHGLVTKRMNPAAVDALLPAAEDRIRRLQLLGIKTVVSLEDPSDPAKEGRTASTFNLEKQACDAVGMTFISVPMRNSGANSFETMTDDQTWAVIDAAAQEILHHAKVGGVDFHCSAGHDRTGLVAAYLRVREQHWPVSEAIAEMRRLGHQVPQFSTDNGLSSWHENHLKAIAAKLIADPTATPPAHHPTHAPVIDAH